MKQNMNERINAYRRKHRLRSRWAKLFSVMACLVVFCTVYALILPAITLEKKEAGDTAQVEAAAGYHVSLYSDSSAAGTQQINLPRDAHILLSLNESASAYQWQIWSQDSGSWLDIYGDKGQNCEVYYAKLENMFSGDSARLRAVADVNGTEWVSDTVNITVADISMETTAEEPVILDAGSAPLGDVSGDGNNDQTEGGIPADHSGSTEAAETYGAEIPDAGSGDALEGDGSDVLEDDGSAAEMESTDVSEENSPMMYRAAQTDNVGENSSPEEGIAPVADDDPPEQTKYTVRVNYVRQVDTGAVSVADPWWATFSSTGDTGSYEVKFPVVQGFKISEVFVSDDSVEPSLVHDSDGTTIVGLTLPETITGDLTYSVIYEADTVKYIVNHLKQNVSDLTKYDVIETEEKYDLTGTLLRNDAKTYEGFTLVAYEYPTLAGDGSTVVEIKYDRAYYKIDFVLNGGEGVNGIYVPYGADISSMVMDEMTTPTKPGYDFQGWYTDEALNDLFTGDFPATMPAANSIYYAKWSAGETAYSVAVYVESLTEGDYDFLCSFNLQAMTGTAVEYTDIEIRNKLREIQSDENAEGYQPTLKYFTMDHGDQIAEVNGDGSTTVNVYFTRNSYTLRFVYGRSYIDGRNTIYQVSTLNNAYSSHFLTDGMTTGYDLASGCYWGENVTSNNTSPFSFSNEFQTVMNANSGRFDTGSFDEVCTIQSPSSTRNRNYTYYYFDLTAKYDEDIRAYWPQAESVVLRKSNTSSVRNIDWGVQYGSEYQKVHAPVGDRPGQPNIQPYYANMDSMLIIDAEDTADQGSTHTLVSYNSTSTIYTWDYTYYYEALSAGGNTVEHNGKYYVQGESATVRTTLASQEAQDLPVVGMKGYMVPSVDNNTVTVSAGRQANFYYDRERYSITFYNGYWGRKVVEDIPFGMSLSDYEGTATCSYDDGAGMVEELPDEIFKLSEAQPLLANRIDENFAAKYQFGGTWHTSWSEAAHSGVGDVFEWSDDLVMPQNNIVLYPSWEPHEYKATFYWQNIQNPVLKDADGEYERGAVPLDEYPLAEQTYNYDGKLEDFDAEYAQYQFLHWSYFIWTEDCEVPDEDGGIATVYKAGTNLYVPDEVLTNPEIQEAYQEFVTQEMREGHLKEVRLDFDTATFTSNAAIFGTWNDVVYLPYTVHYVLLNADVDDDVQVARVDGGIAYDAYGSAIGVQIADDSTDNRLAGLDITLTAKTDDELYPEYQPTDTQACFPIGSPTHALHMDIQKDKLEYTFVYRQTQPVTYKVQYLTPELDEFGNPVMEDGKIVYEDLEPSIEVTTTQAIVTENSLAVRGYSLTADPETGKRDYQITRILTYADPKPDGSAGTVITDANTITFYYTRDENAIEYTVEYYYQQLDGTYTKHDAEMTLPGTVGETYKAEEITIPGWWCDRSVDGTHESQMLPGGGMTLRLYYSAYPLRITKNWSATVRESDKKPVELTIYEAIQQTDNSNQAEVVSDGSMSNANMTLSEDNSWTGMIYLPCLEYLEDDPDTGDAQVMPYTDRFYALVETTDGFAPAYNGSVENTMQNVFVDGAQIKAAQVVLGTVSDSGDGTNTVAAAEITVTNAPAEALPDTGGFGTLLYTISGWMLICAAFVIHGYTLSHKCGRGTKK